MQQMGLQIFNASNFTAQGRCQSSVKELEICAFWLSLRGFYRVICRAVSLVQVFNPPYVPTPDQEVHMPGIAKAWAGGLRGRVVIDRFLPMVLPNLETAFQFISPYMLACDTFGHSFHLQAVSKSKYLK